MDRTIAAPSSAAELCAAVRHGHAFDLSALNRILDFDERRGRLEVQAGTRWRSLAEELRPRDSRAAAVRTTMPTVGESLARNAAGPDGRPAVTHVEAIALVTPEGELCRVSRGSRSELFALAVGGHGLFGVPYSVTLSVPSLERAIAEAAPIEAVDFSAAGAPAATLQLFVPPERLEPVLGAVRERCEARRVALHGIEARRVLREADTFLRWARRDYLELNLKLAVAATLADAVRSIQLRREVIDIVIAEGGSFPISCTPEATRNQTLACYPELARFIAEKRRLDRRERLVNAWYRHQCRMLEREGGAARSVSYAAA